MQPVFRNICFVCVVALLASADVHSDDTPSAVIPEVHHDGRIFPVPPQSVDQKWLPVMPPDKASPTADPKKVAKDSAEFEHEQTLVLHPLVSLGVPLHRPPVQFEGEKAKSKKEEAADEDDEEDEEDEDDKVMPKESGHSSKQKLPLALELPTLSAVEGGKACFCDVARLHGRCRKWFPHDHRTWCVITGDNCQGAVHRMPNRLRWAPCTTHSTARGQPAVLQQSTDEPGLPTMPPVKSTEEAVSVFRPHPLADIFPSRRKGTKKMAKTGLQISAKKTGAAKNQPVGTTSWLNSPGIIVLGLTVVSLFMGVVGYSAYHFDKKAKSCTSAAEQQPMIAHTMAEEP